MTAASSSALPASLPPGPKRASLGDWIAWITRPLRFMEDYTRRYGESFLVPGLPGRGPMIWLGEPDAIRDVFSAAPDELHAGEANFIVEGILGKHSLLMLDGEAHRRTRKLMMPPFHGERMRAYGQTMRAVAAQEIARWPLGEPISLLAEMQAITLDVILRTVFGLDEGPRMERLRDLLREGLARASSVVVFGASMILGSARLRDWIADSSKPIYPFRRFSPLANLSFNLAPLVPGSSLYAVMQKTDELLYSEFQRRRALPDLGSREDVLSMLMSARDESGNAMTDIELRDEMMTLLLAGHETTAISLAWAFHHLLVNPQAMTRLHAELAPLLAGGAPEPEQIASLPYLDAVVKETMRLTPVVPLIARVAKRDIAIGRYHIPKGAIVMPNIYVTQHRADIWPDPEQFRPERFLEKKPTPHEYLPFGGGARRCIGAAFALYEMKLVIAEVVTRTTLEECDKSVTIERRGIMFAPTGGTRVLVRGRV